MRLSAEQALAQGALSAAAFKDEVFETTYYPGTKDQAAALPIDLKPGGTFSGVELRILKSSWVRVRGRVIDGATGQPHSAVVGLALPFYGTDQRNINGRVTEGAFDLRAPAGSYMLSAQASRTTPNGPYSSRRSCRLWSAIATSTTSRSRCFPASPSMAGCESTGARLEETIRNCNGR